MYVAKAAREPFESYSPAQDTYSTDRLALVADLRKAIDDGTLALAYQPMIDLERGAIVGVEALLRWTHASQGPIGPDVFIPLAEHSGLIGRITTYVLEAAARSPMPGRKPAWTSPCRSTSRSATSNGRGSRSRSATRCNGTGSPRDRLRLEITEGSVMDQPDRALATFRSSPRVGVGLSVDDFGTGVFLARVPAAAARQRAQDRPLVRARTGE